MENIENTEKIENTNQMTLLIIAQNTLFVNQMTQKKVWQLYIPSKEHKYCYTCNGRVQGSEPARRFCLHVNRKSSFLQL